VTNAFPAGIGGLVGVLVFWSFVAAWVVVLGLIALVQLPRGYREGRRLVTRVLRLVNEPPLTAELAKAEADTRRLTAALERIPPLQQRAQIALTTIRTTPLIPPAVGQTFRRIRNEIQAFRQALR
jgi:hypothetical protein